MKRTFEIEFPDDCGPLWMNSYNLGMCLTTNIFTSNVDLLIRDITPGSEESHPVGVKGIRNHDFARTLSKERAGRVWCDNRISDKELDAEVAEVVADALYEVWGTGKLDSDLDRLGDVEDYVREKIN